jgi:hypothetical protein
MANVIALFLGDFPLIMTILGLILGFIRKNYLGYLFFFGLGLSGLWGFTYHVFFPDIAAKYIGWAPSPFQFEVGMANLGVGIVGLFGLKAKKSYQIAGTLFTLCLFWGAAYGHVVQMLQTHNFAPGNAGAVFYNDIIMPLLLVIFLFLKKKEE